MEPQEFIDKLYLPYRARLDLNDIDSMTLSII